jgi:hypothetical protein
MTGRGTFHHTGTGGPSHTPSLHKISGKNDEKKSQRKSKGYKELEEEEFIGHYVVLIGYVLIISMGMEAHFFYLDMIKRVIWFFIEIQVVRVVYVRLELLNWKNHIDLKELIVI